MTDEDYELTICDRCSDEIPLAETQVGPAETEWGHCTLCAVCHSEVTP